MEEAGKKYFWLKLHKGFFKRHDIQIIESMPNGKDYVLFYLKLLVESIDHDGMLRFNDAIPYNEGMLATITNTNVDIVRSAIKIMESLGLLEVLDDGSFYMRQIETFTGSVTQWAEKKRIYREHKKLLQSGQAGGQKEDMSDKSKSKEIEKDLEKESVKYPQDSHPLILATLLMTEHQRSDPRYTVTPATLQKWATDIDKLMRLDGRTASEVEAVIRWCQTPGGFWVPNILSGSKLREKFPTLLLQSQAKKTTERQKEFHDMTEEEKQYAIDKAMGRVS